MASELFPECDYCGYEYSPMDPLKQVIVFAQTDGTSVKLCRDCLIMLGRMSEQDRDQFFLEMGLNKDVADADRMANGDGGKPII